MLPEGHYRCIVEAAGVWGSGGKLGASDEKDLWWFLVTAISKSSFERVLDVATQSFVAESDSVFNLSDVLLAQLFWQRGGDSIIDWLAIIRQGVPKPTTSLHALLLRALDVGVVRYVFAQSPQIIPLFLRQAAAQQTQERSDISHESVGPSNEMEHVPFDCNPLSS